MYMRTRLEVIRALQEIENEMIEQGRQLDVFLARNEASNVLLTWEATEANLAKKDPLIRQLRRIRAGKAA